LKTIVQPIKPKINSSSGLPRTPITSLPNKHSTHSQSKITLKSHIETLDNNENKHPIKFDAFTVDKGGNVTPLTAHEKSMFPKTAGRQSKNILPPLQKRNCKSTFVTPKLSVRKVLPKRKSSDIVLLNNVKTFAVKTKAGKNSDKSTKSNQDASIIIKDFMKYKNAYLFGVMDGHGDYGKLISDQLTIILPKYLENTENDNIKNCNEKLLLGTKSSRSYLILQAFEKTQTEIMQKPEDSMHSGSTATIVLLMGKTLVCANVGDSRAIMASRAEEKQKFGMSDTNKKWTITQISKDHKPDIQQEYMRIVKSNGQVDTFRGILYDIIK